MKCEMKEQVPLSEYSSWKVGGKADYLAHPSSVEELKEVLIWAKEKKHPVSVLGGGTNILISDQGIRGLVIHTKFLRGIEEKLENSWWHLDCLSGTPKSFALRSFLKHKLEPAIFLTGLPGNMGGGVVMNAGVGGPEVPREFCEIVHWVEVLRMDGQRLDRIEKSSLEWGYRHSRGWQPGIITRVGLRWPMEPREDIIKAIQKATRQRVTKQPINQPSCGSVFRNPKLHFSGKLIEDCRLKGCQIGGAEVSMKHGNFIITHPHAKARDIHELIQHVRSVVKERKSIELQTEVIYMGEWS